MVVKIPTISDELVPLIMFCYMIFLFSFISLKKMVPESGRKLKSLVKRIGLLHLLSVTKLPLKSY